MEEKQLLPGKDAAVFVGGKHLTSDLSRAIRLEASRETAKEFLINKCKWTSEQSDEVDWDMSDAMYVPWKRNQMATYVQDVVIQAAHRFLRDKTAGLLSTTKD